MVGLTLTCQAAPFMPKQTLPIANNRKHYFDQLHLHPDCKWAEHNNYFSRQQNRNNRTRSKLDGNSQLSTSTNLTVSFLKSGLPTVAAGISDNNVTEYDFNITVTVPTGMNFPFGANATHTAITQALIPLVSKYDRETNNYPGNTTIVSALWVDMPIVDGENTFSLFSYQQLDSAHVTSLTNDLFNVFAVAMTTGS